MSGVLFTLLLIAIEVVVVLVLLGTWISEGRRRSDELERLERLARALDADHDGNGHTHRREGAPGRGGPTG